MPEAVRGLAAPVWMLRHGQRAARACGRGGGVMIRRRVFTADKLREECGVFGVHRATTTPRPTPCSACTPCSTAARRPGGIVSFDGAIFLAHRALGLVGDHFSNEAVIGALPGHAAIGHVRYSTAGAPLLRNVQPLYADFAFGGLALGHNGNLTNALALRRVGAGRAGVSVPVDLRIPR